MHGFLGFVICIRQNPNLNVLQGGILTDSSAVV
jgi:hypothetical protein